ncbi:MAG: tRNA lysidine(34) synthetase TilS [Dongiaceae bacterium]
MYPLTPPAADQGVKNLSAGEFAALMRELEPFESSPHLAIAVSGGADSMALCLLADEWAKAKGGKVTALTVDHGLRPSSAKEADQVGQMLKSQNIEHRVLKWQGDKPSQNIQALARQARYDLLTKFCHTQGICHLLFGHHAQDQAETFFLNLARGSGLYGLAAMAALSYHSSCRILRPLLSIEPARLKATVTVSGLKPLQDPSNLDERFERVQLRQSWPALAKLGLDQERLQKTIDSLQRARRAVEDAANKALVRSFELYAGGYGYLDVALLGQESEEIGLRALSQILRAIGGESYVPRFNSLQNLWREMIDTPFAAAKTLGGCWLVPENHHMVLICREPELPAALEAPFAEEIYWDQRFLIRLPAKILPTLTMVKALGQEGWSEVKKNENLPHLDLPHPARLSLPALYDSNGLLAVPLLGHFRENMQDIEIKCFFKPRTALSSPRI